MPKDNENVPVFPDEPIARLESQSFSPDQMVRCEECLRANPPTRANCLYCAAVLPTNETTVHLQKPTLRPLEKWEQGYNNILWPPPANLGEPGLIEAAALLRLTTTDLARILEFGMSLPVARAATLDDALLVQRRLEPLGLGTRIVPDAELGAEETATTKVRAIEIDDTGIRAFQTPETPAVHIQWSNFELLVVGRLITRRVELKEQKGARSEHSIVDSSEFFTDEPVFELHSKGLATSYRFSANSFDFTCLGKTKSLLAAENFATLIKRFCENAPHAELDESYNLVRKALEVVWPSQQQNESGGWRRERPGKYIVGSATETSNERQFLRYSRLRYYLHAKQK
ncbi:MAG: hypothetical protein M3R52_11570 [Acidobacteriota bacterium]|nr:hypothetical protein [Acidobacteriota bacterium]